MRDRHRQEQSFARRHRVRGGDAVGLDAQALVRVHDALRSDVVPDVHSTSAGAFTSATRSGTGSPCHTGSAPSRTTISVTVEAGVAHQRDVVGAAERRGHRGDARAGLPEDEADFARAAASG